MTKNQKLSQKDKNEHRLEITLSTKTKNGWSPPTMKRYAVRTGMNSTFGPGIDASMSDS